MTAYDDTACGHDCTHALGPCTCARDGNASRCVHHTQEEYEDRWRARDDYPTEAREGLPHPAYFSDGVSFVWSGHPEGEIQVCPGGYGEPVADRIGPEFLGPDFLTRDVPASRSLSWVLGMFRQTCEEWLEKQR